ncbi:MAG: TraB/VirB10 family protein [Bdellovibrionales bacterium]|nr:TraB/VirB10 family protein [Bdellovibrionales bacterium]
MKQKVEDLKILLKGDRKAQVICGVVVLMILFLIFAEPAPRRRNTQQKIIETESPSMGAEEAYKDLLQSFTAELDELKEVSQRNSEDTRKLTENMSNYEERTAEIFKKMLERMSDIEQKQVATNYSNQSPAATDAVVEDVQAEEDSLEAFGDIKTELAPPPLPKPPKLAVVGAGDSVSVKLLAGVNAPTDGTPYPVVFELSGDIQGPDGSTLPIGEARLIAAAQGSLADQRALFRLTSLNLALPTGERRVIDVDGWIVGEDGVRGMEGILIDPIGKLVGAAGFAGLVQGVGEGLSRGQVNTSTNGLGLTERWVEGDVGTYAVGEGIAGAANQYAGLVKERVDELVPHVRVLSGRKATAVFSKTFTINGLFEELVDDSTDFDSLD